MTENELWIIVAAILAAVVIVIALLARRRQGYVEEKPKEQGYVASQDRPYVKPKPVENEPAPPSNEIPVRPAAEPAPEPAPAPAPAPKRRADGPEGNSLADEYSAAATDVAGDMLGVQAHAQLPGGTAPPDDLQLIKGVGPKLATRLNELGIARFEQLAALSPNEVAILDGKLGPFKGRIERDRVVEQAGFLARGDREGFEERFGKLGG